MASINTSYHKNYFPEENSGVCVVRRKDESDEDLLKRFRKKYSKSGIAKEVRDRMYFEKPCNKRRRKRMQAIRLIKEENEKREFLSDKMDKINQMKNKNKRKGYKNDSSRGRQDSGRSYEGNEDKGWTDTTS